MRIRWRGFELPTRVEKDESVSTAYYGRFAADPFERGFATTVSNGLRRVLLSSVRCGSPRRAHRRCQQRVHLVEGVLEDTTQIILNIKRLRCVCLW